MTFEETFNDTFGLYFYHAPEALEVAKKRIIAAVAELVKEVIGEDESLVGSLGKNTQGQRGTLRTSLNERIKDRDELRAEQRQSLLDALGEKV